MENKGHTDGVLGQTTYFWKWITGCPHLLAITVCFSGHLYQQVGAANRKYIKNAFLKAPSNSFSTHEYQKLKTPANARQSTSRYYTSICLPPF